MKYNSYLIINLQLKIGITTKSQIYYRKKQRKQNKDEM